MRRVVAIAAAALAVAWLAPASSAETRVRHHVKHPNARASIAPDRRPSIELPPGYNPGGPNYTTCDRINHDRMLVGTCR
jgi:hypothetical protein